MRTLEQYLDFITSEHQNKPKFAASLAAAVGPLADLQAFLQTVPSLFDLDNAIGVQLDATGLWIGRRRFIPQPLPNMWFSFDTPFKGFDEGFWKGPFDVGTMLDRLDDNTFRRLLRAKILSNNWDGTIPSAQFIIDTFFGLALPPRPITPVDFDSEFTTDFNILTGYPDFNSDFNSDFAIDVPSPISPGTHILVDDEADVSTTRSFFAFDDPARGCDGPAVWFQEGMTISTLPSLNMRVTVAVAGKIPPIVDLEILAQNLIPLSIGGVDQRVRVVTVDNTPLFGFDLDNEYVAGFGSGSWGASPQFVVDQLLEE